MANTIDERVVKMQFDNAQFEKNVQTSLGTLGKLKDALKFDKVDMSGIASNIEKITDKVTSLGGIWDTALNRISNKIVDVGQNIAKAFVFDPPSDGFNEYELKMDSLKVIMESSHESLETVNKYLNELNKYSDQTIYSFSDMTASIGKFTNAGVDLDTSVNAIKGIANEAALAGASTQDASRAMYNFAQALSAGSVKLIDWKSIENANMATQDFKNELISTAVELGTLTKVGDKYVSTTTNMQGKISDAFDASQGFNDSLAHQWMTTDVLTKTLGRYADESTDVGKRATQAATEVRTFSAMMDALKEAVGSGWAQTWEILFGNMEEATQLWTSINNVLSGFIDKTSDARNNLLQGWKDLGGRAKLLEGLSNVFQILGNVIKPFSDAMKVLIPPMTAEKLVELTTKFADFTGKIKKATETFGTVTRTMEGHFTNFLDFTTESTDEAAGKTVDNLDKIKEAVKSVVNGDFGNDEERFNGLKAAGFDPDEIQDYVNKIHELSNGSWDLSDEMMNSAAEALGYNEKVAQSAASSMETAADKLSDVAVEMDRVTSGSNILTRILITTGVMIQRVFGSGVKILGAVKQAWTESFSPIKITLGDLERFHYSLLRLSSSLVISDETLNKIKNTAKDFFTAFKTVVDLVTKFAIKSLPEVIRIGKSVASAVGDVVLEIASFISGVASAIARSAALSKIFDAVSFVIAKFAKGVEIAAEVIKYFSGKISDGLKYILNYFKLLKVGTKVASALDKTFGKTSGKFDEFKKKLSEKFGFKNLDEFKSKMDAVFDRMSKDFLIPGLERFTEFVMDLIDGKASLGKLTKLVTDFGKGIGDFFKTIVFPKNNAFEVANEQVDKLVGNASRIQGVGKVFKALGEGPFNFFKNIVSPEQKNGFKVLGDEVDGFVDKATMLQKANKIARNLGESLRAAIDGIDFKSIGSTILSKLGEVFGDVTTVAKSFVQGLTDSGGGVGKATSSIADGFIGGFSKLIGTGSSTIGKLQDFSGSFKDVVSNIGKPFESGNVGKGFKDFTTALNDADKVVPVTLGDKLHNLAVDVKRFIAEIDYKKLLTFARSIKVFTSIFNGIKLTKSFSGMADNIGGFFKGLSEDGLKINAIPEESKFTKLVKVAVAVALVAKSMAMIAEIPEDRLQSSVGVVAGIAGVMTVIVILLEKMKVAKKADLGGASKTMMALAVSIYIIAKAMELLGDANPASLVAGGIAVGALMFVLTQAVKSLKKLKIKPAAVLAPIGFAIALRLLVKAVLTLGEADITTLAKGGVVVYIMMTLLESAMDSLRSMNLNAAAVFAPLSFVVALGLLLVEVVAYSLIPRTLLVSGLIRVGIMLGLLEGVSTSLKGMNLTPATVLAPLAFTGALLLLIIAVAALGIMPPSIFKKGLLAVTALGGLLIGMYALTNFISKKFEGADISSVSNLIALVAAIDLLALAVVVLAFIPGPKLAKGVIAVGFLGGLLVGLSALLSLISSKFENGINPSIIGSLVGIVLAIVALGTVAVLLALIPGPQLAKGIIALGFLGAILTGMEYMLVKASKEMNISAANIFAMIASVAAITMLATTALMLAVIPGPKLAKGVVVIAVLGAVLMAMEYALSKSSKIEMKNIGAMLASVIAIRMLALTAVLIGLVPLPKLAKGVGVIIVLGAVLGVLQMVLSKASFDAMAIVGIVGIVAAILILVGAVTYLGSMDVGQLGQGIIALGLLTAVLAGLCALAGPLQTLALAFLTFAAGAFLIGAGFMLVADGVMKLVMAMALLSTIDTKSFLVNLLAFLPVLMLVVAGFAALGAVALLLGPSVVIILGLAAAFALFGAGLYLIVSAIEKFVGVAGNIGSAVASAAGSVVQNAGKILSGLRDSVLKGLKFLADNVGPFMKKAGELIAGAAKGIAKNAPKVASKVGEVVSKGLKKLADNAPKFLKAGGELIAKAASGIAKNAPKIAAKAGEAASKGLKKLRDGLPKFLSIGKDIAGKVASGIANAASKVANKAKEVINKAKNAMSNKKGEFNKIGKDMMEGLRSGIASKASAIAEKAKSIVSSAVSAAKAKLQSHSPSKVFIRIGQDVDNGFIIGLDNLANKVAETSANVAEGVVDAAREPLDKLADLMSSDTVDDPTITPVMDLSEIQNGANRLYSMMSDVDRYSLNGNIALANDASLSINRDQRRKQESENQMIGNLIDAINGLSALIGNTGNIYNVNGVTYDDGSNVSSAVRSLIRAAKIEGRA